MAVCEVNGVKIYYEVKGVGKAIVFTHGASWNHKQWREQVDYFSESYQTIVWDAAIRYPERVEGLILIGTPFTNAFNWYEKLFVPLNRWSSRLISMKLSAKLSATPLSKFNTNNKSYIENTMQMIPHKNWVRIWDAVTRMESRKDLHNVKCRTLLLCGDHDSMTLRQQEYMRKNIPHAVLKIVSRAHHATNLDNPKEVNEFIQDCLLKTNS